MCNEIKCAIQYTVDLINNNINRDVQEERGKIIVLWFFNGNNCDKPPFGTFIFRKCTILINCTT